MNITNLYKQLGDGKVTKDFFMKNVRIQFPQYVSPTTIYEDAVKILKGKKIISEAHKLSTDQIVDRLNPYHFKKAMEKELSNQKEMSADVYERVKKKVAKKMQKNPMAYEDQVFANAKEVEKHDEKLHLQKVEGRKLVDKANSMKVKKKNEKANTKVSKKENRKGNPKGVKQMTYNAKKAKGISETMPVTGKQKVLEALKESLEENMYHDYHSGKQVHTPDGEGTVVSVSGGTLTVDLGGGNLKDFQINVVDKATRDAHFSKMPNLGKYDMSQMKDENETSQYGNITPKGEIEAEKSKSHDKLKSILEKILALPEMKEIAKKLKEYTKYSIGDPSKPDVQYRKTADSDLEVQLKKVGVPFKKTQG